MHEKFVKNEPLHKFMPFYLCILACILMYGVIKIQLCGKNLCIWPELDSHVLHTK